MIQLQSEEDLFAIGQALSFKIDAEIDRELENGQWLRFAEAAMPINAKTLFDAGAWTDLFEKSAIMSANYADAMIKETKRRGKL